MRTAAACSVAVLLLAGCASAPAGPDLTLIETETEPGPDGVVTMTASDALRFSTALVTAPPGDIGFQLTCGGAVEHNIVVEGENGNQPIAICARGETGPVGTIDLGPGTYSYFCSIPGHKITMTGELVVG